MVRAGSEVAPSLRLALHIGILGIRRKSQRKNISAERTDYLVFVIWLALFWHPGPTDEPIRRA